MPTGDKNIMHNNGERYITVSYRILAEEAKGLLRCSSELELSGKTLYRR